MLPTQPVAQMVGLYKGLHLPGILPGQVWWALSKSGTFAGAVEVFSGALFLLRTSIRDQDWTSPSLLGGV